MVFNNLILDHVMSDRILEDVYRSIDQDLEFCDKAIYKFTHMPLRRHLDEAGAIKLSDRKQKSKDTLKKSGKVVDNGWTYYTPISKDANSTATALREKYVDLIIKTQDNKCALWLPSVKRHDNVCIGDCWNKPSTFDTVFYMQIQTDHWHSLKADGKKHLENIAFLCANHNENIKTQSMPANLKFNFQGIYKDRIEYVEQNRADLFTSTEWKHFKQELNHFEGRVIL